MRNPVINLTSKFIFRCFVNHLPIISYNVFFHNLENYSKTLPGDMKWRERTGTYCQIKIHFSVETN